ncbi:hypothetical protein [Kitasatospora sp. NPDC101183]|uniref:hypothetical protein n=1 Tax=Kitasatospora sp. NPDC101183 TaxID=3364100 RepID=UPI0037F7E6DA
MRTAHTGSTTTDRAALVVSRLILGAEVLGSLWVAVVTWMLRGLFYFDEDGRSGLLGPAVALAWALLCAATLVATRRGGGRGVFTAAAVVHALAAAWASWHTVWPLAAGAVGAAAVLALAGRRGARTPLRLRGLSG